MPSSVNEKYDVILFGVNSSNSNSNSITGKLVVEYFLHHNDDRSSNIKFAVCCTNRIKCQAWLQPIVGRINYGNTNPNTQKRLPPILEVIGGSNTTNDNNNNGKPSSLSSLSSATEEIGDAMAGIVSQTKVVLSCYNNSNDNNLLLVKLCAELGKDYADVGGGGTTNNQENDDLDFLFYSQITAKYHRVAVQSRSRILHGVYCIPQDLTVYEMNRYAADANFKNKSNTLLLMRACTCSEFSTIPTSAGAGAASTNSKKGDCGTNCECKYHTKDISPTTITSSKQFTKLKQKKIYFDDYGFDDVDIGFSNDPPSSLKVGAGSMGSTAVNCIRRSNELSQYNKEFEYGDMVYYEGEGDCVWSAITSILPKSLLQIMSQPQPSSSVPEPGGVGEGQPPPDRETMEKGWMTLHGRGVLVDTVTKKKSRLHAKFHFNKDMRHLYKAALLAETGMLLLETHGGGGRNRSSGGVVGGVLTPSAAFGTKLTQHILDKLDATFEMKEIYEVEREIDIMRISTSTAKAKAKQEIIEEEKKEDEMELSCSNSSRWTAP